MDGLLTVIHSEKGGDGMSSMQTDLPLLTEHDEEAIKIFIREFEVCSSCFCHMPSLAHICFMSINPAIICGSANCVLNLKARLPWDHF
jgi:hypothetical protein